MRPPKEMSSGWRLAYCYVRWLIAIGAYFWAWRDPSELSLCLAILPVLYWHVKLNNAGMHHLLYRKRRPWEWPY